MKRKNEYKVVYISDDGKKKSWFKDEITKYEEKQQEKNFEERTKVANISMSTFLYFFKKGDIKKFKEFHPEAYFDAISDNEEGYFVYVYDSSYDNIGDNHHLYCCKWYETLIQGKINHYITILDNIKKNETRGAKNK